MIENMTRTFKALSDPTRLKILKLLEHGELCVCDITAALDMVQPKVSFHLRELKKAGLVKDRRAGKWSHYRIDDSDLFRRFIIMTVIEKISTREMAQDFERMKKFMSEKNSKSSCSAGK